MPKDKDIIVHPVERLETYEGDAYSNWRNPHTLDNSCIRYIVDRVKGDLLVIDNVLRYKIHGVDVVKGYQGYGGDGVLRYKRHGVDDVQGMVFMLSYATKYMMFMLSYATKYIYLDNINIIYDLHVV